MMKCCNLENRVNPKDSHVDRKMNRTALIRHLLARICNPCVIMTRIANPRQREETIFAITM